MSEDPARPARFILVPGAGGSAWYWHLVEPELRNRGHDAVAVGLPAADDGAGLPEYAAAVVRVIGKRAPRRVILVAQSLAGFVAPLVCDRARIALLVLVNAMIPLPGETPGAWWGNTRHAEANGRVDFFHDVPQPVVDAAFAQGEPRQSDTVFGSPCRFERWPDVPTRVLIARDDRFFPLDFQRRVARERLGIVPDEMPGGHLVALSRPVELVERLVAYAAELQPPGG